MTHRGPDDCGLWTCGDGSVTLVQRRLAIVDLSAGGHQPKADATGRIHVVFNGEMYNFREVRRELESAYDEPIGDSSAIPTFIVSRDSAARDGGFGWGWRR